MFTTRLQVICDPDFAEILMAEIAEAGFDSFLETEKGFEAYVEEKKYDAVLLEAIRKKYGHVNPLIFFEDKIKKRNWNAEWEKNLEPIVVEGKCLVRAEFHKPDRKYPYEIVVTPKMSFGTGHHETTYLMLKNQMEVDHSGKRVMDAGCGTAILSIMASLRGAREVEAFDIDEWSVINGEENVANNGCSNVRIRQGKIREMAFEGLFDIILANINKNVLLNDLTAYSSLLRPGGLLLLSGFYADDAEDIIRAGRQSGLRELSRDERNSWAAVLLARE